MPPRKRRNRKFHEETVSEDISANKPGQGPPVASSSSAAAAASSSGSGSQHVLPESVLTEEYHRLPSKRIKVAHETIEVNPHSSSTETPGRSNSSVHEASRPVVDSTQEQPADKNDYTIAASELASIQVDDDNGPTPGGGGSEDPEAQAGPSSSRTEQPKRKQVRCTSYLYCI